MLVETEALDLGEVHIGFFRGHIVGREANDRIILPVIHLVEHNRCLSCIHEHLLLYWYEVPVDVRLGLSLEDYSILAYVGNYVPSPSTFLALEVVLFLVVVADQSDMLTEYSVERDGSEACSKHHSVDSNMQIARLLLIALLGLRVKPRAVWLAISK